MKKLLLRTGLLTIGNLAILSDNFTLNVEAQTPEIMLSVGEAEFQLHNELLVKKYANIYEINSEVVVSKVKEITGDFNNYDWNHDFGIYGVKYENEEIALLTLVRDIYKNPEKYNLEYEDLETDYEHETDEYYEDILSNYSDILGVNKEIALSISYAECGPNLDSANFLENNNPAGLGPFNYYNNIEHGTIEYLFFLKDSCGCTKDSDKSFFYRIGPSYSASDGSHWINLTTSHYNNIITDYYYYAYNRGYQKVLH